MSTGVMELLVPFLALALKKTKQNYLGVVNVVSVHF